MAPKAIASASSVPAAAGAFTDDKNVVVANGYLMLTPGFAAGTLSGGGIISNTPIKITLDVNGVPSAGQTMYCSDQFSSPTNPAFRVFVFNSNDSFVADLGNCVISGAAPVDLTTITATSSGASYTGAVLLTPTGNQTITTGDLILSAGSYRLASGQVVAWNSDTGFSRDSAGVIDVGNGGAGDTSGSLKLTTLTASSAGNLQQIVSKATSDANQGYSAQNTVQNWTFGVRQDNAEAFILRDTTGGSDLLLIPITKGAVSILETAAPSGAASRDILYADSTAHRLKMNNNNGGALTVAATSGDTFTTTTLTSPVINGSPTGTGIPTITLKKGSGAGNYTGTNTSYSNVDGTNLSYTVTIPTGWKLSIATSGVIEVSTAAVAVFAALADGGSVIVEAGLNTINVGVFQMFALNWAISGDGASHTITLQAKTANSSDAWTIGNANSTSTCSMVFILSPSN